MKKTKILAFPFAMGGASAYHLLKKDFENSDYQICAFNYPGHESRYDENIQYSMQGIAQDMYRQISDYLDEDYCLLGYSMGGIICYELYQLIKRNHRKLPLHVFLVSADSPDEKSEYTDCENMTVKRVRDILTEMGGTPNEILESDDMLELLLPVVKGDLCAYEKYIPTQDYKIDCNVTLIRGTNEDNTYCRQSWNGYFTKQCDYHEVEGGHFFMFDDPKGMRAVSDIIRKAL